MKTAKILATIAFGMVSTLSAQTVDSTDSIPLEGIETSHPHRMPKLISLETAEIVESYGIGFWAWATWPSWAIPWRRCGPPASSPIG
jgi:hypothetical protein